MAVENKKMQQRRDTAANWTAANPILAAGEIGWESDTDQFKIGDGVNAWVDIVKYYTHNTAASTTDALTGTDTSKYITPDALAALWEQGPDITSAGTISVGEGGYFNVTGTTTITDIDFATDKAGRKAWLKFAGILTLTHNSTTLILPTAASISTAAGDIACFVSEGSDNVRCISYTRASGAALTGGGITNSAGNNVIPKSDGTNIVASQLTDNGTDITQSGSGKFIVPNAGFQVGALSGTYGNRWFGDGSSYTGFGIPYGTSGIFYLFDSSGNAKFSVTGAGAIVTSYYVEAVEVTAPAAPAADGVRIYAEDNGAGKTRLMALFSSGAAQQIAIQP